MSDILETSEGFRGEYSFLSNFTTLEKPLCGDGLCFPTIEHFYQAMKTKDKALRKVISEHPSKGLKKFVRENVKLREDWDEIKLQVMEYGLRWKYSDNNPVLKRKLIGTEGIRLVEWNYWGDIFWGKSIQTGEGENNLGELSMKIREEVL